MINKDTYIKALSNIGLNEDIALINEGEEEMSDHVKSLIDNGDFIINDYDRFVASRDKNPKYKGYITRYNPKELKDDGFTTYQVNGYDIGFALHPLRDGNVDITNVFNNDARAKNVADNLLRAAVRLGGTQLDHYEGKLSDIYGRNGFKEVERYEWDDRYAPQGWDYDTFGRPDVVVRRYDNSVKEAIRDAFISFIKRID